VLYRVSYFLVFSLLRRQHNLAGRHPQASLWAVGGSERRLKRRASSFQETGAVV